jgi:hypothetical protein
MDDDDKTYLYLTLDQLILATVRFDDDLDSAIVSAVGEFAKHRGTALWIEDTADGSPRKYEDPATARLGLPDNRTVVDIVVRSGRSPTDDYAVLTSDKTPTRFSLIVVSAEAEYSQAIEALRTAVATSAPGDDEATYDIQVLKDAVVAAGERASGAHPPIGINFHSDIDAVLAESAWRLAGSRIASRVSGIQIGAITRIHDWEMIPAVRFKFQLEDEVTWRDAYAFVRKEDGEWKVAPREVSWLQERKRQYRINDAQIGVIHELLEELGMREE